MFFRPIGRWRTRSAADPGVAGRCAGPHERLGSAGGNRRERGGHAAEDFAAREPPALARPRSARCEPSGGVGCGGLAGEAPRVRSPRRGDLSSPASRQSVGSVRARLRGRPRRWTQWFCMPESGRSGAKLVYLATRFSGGSGVPGDTLSAVRSVPGDTLSTLLAKGRRTVCWLPTAIVAFHRSARCGCAKGIVTNLLLAKDDCRKEKANNDWRRTITQNLVSNVKGPGAGGRSGTPASVGHGVGEA